MLLWIMKEFDCWFLSLSIHEAQKSLIFFSLILQWCSSSGCSFMTVYRSGMDFWYTKINVQLVGVQNAKNSENSENLISFTIESEAAVIAESCGEFQWFCYSFLASDDHVTKKDLRMQNHPLVKIYITFNFSFLPSFFR